MSLIPCRHFRHLASRLSIFLILIFGSFACAENNPNELIPPVRIPISLTEAGEIVNTRVNVVDHDVYQFDLRFYFKEKDFEGRERLRKLLGDHTVDRYRKAVNPGIPTPVLLKIVCIDNEKPSGLAYQKGGDISVTVGGVDNFHRIIGFIELPPGMYDVRLVLQQATPALSETPIVFLIWGSSFKTNFKPKFDRKTRCLQ